MSELITLAAAAEKLPVPTSYQTVYRWAVDGVRIGSQTIKLQTEGCGTRLYTRAEWVAEFQSRIDAARAAIPA